MGRQYDIKDEYGRKIGTIEDQPTATDRAVGAALFFYMFRWPLLILFVIAVIVTIPWLIIQGIGNAIEYSKNPSIERQFSAQIATTIEQGIPQLSDSLRSSSITPAMKQYFTEEAIADISKKMEWLRERNQRIDQNLSIGAVTDTRWLRGRYGGDVDKKSQANYACVTVRVKGTRTAQTLAEPLAKSDTIDQSVNLGLVRTNDQWLIMELSEAVGVRVSSTMVLLSYCR